MQELTDPGLATAASSSAAEPPGAALLHIKLTGSLNGEVIHEGDWPAPCKVCKLWRMALRRKPGADCKLMLDGVELSVQQQLEADADTTEYSIEVIWSRQEAARRPIGRAFAALKRDGCIITWGDPAAGGDSSKVADELRSGIQHVYCNGGAFAALKSDGSIVCWGNPNFGGNPPVSVAEQLASGGFVHVAATNIAFAAMKCDGGVVAWGNARGGGDSSIVAQKLASHVQYVAATSRAFAALKRDGSVVAWGDPDKGGDIPDLVAQTLAASGPVQHISANAWAFAVLTAAGLLITWGGSDVCSLQALFADPLKNSDYGGEMPGECAKWLSKNDVQQVVGSAGAFAFIRADGSVVAWGDEDCGGALDSQTADELSSDVLQITPSLGAFAALKADGSVVVWGHERYGGDNRRVQAALTSGVTEVASTQGAFAAVKADGTVVAWGEASEGGDIRTAAAGNLSSGVKSITGKKYALAAVKWDGSVVCWGKHEQGGDCSAVAEMLSSDVVHVF